MVEQVSEDQRIPRPEELIAAQTKKSKDKEVDEAMDALRQKQEAQSQSTIMSNQHDIPGIWEARVLGQARKMYELPCGYVDKKENVFAWITVREMTGKEEDFIASDEVSVLERSSRVLSDCIESLRTEHDGGLIVEDRELLRQIVAGCSDKKGLVPFKFGEPFTSSDRTASLLFLRRTTLGDQYKPEVRCPLTACGMLNKKLVVMLDQIKIERVPRERAKHRKCRIKLPRMSENYGKEVHAELRVLTGVDENRVSLLKPTKANFRTLQIIARLSRISYFKDGEEVVITIPREPEAAIAMVQSLPKKDRDYIRMVYLRIEGSIDTDIEVTCEYCNKDFVFPLDLGQIFFWTRADQKDIDDSEIEWM